MSKQPKLLSRVGTTSTATATAATTAMATATAAAMAAATETEPDTLHIVVIVAPMKIMSRLLRWSIVVLHAKALVVVIHLCALVEWTSR